VISDTHGNHRSITLPDGDVLIHCGDFCKYGRMGEVEDFVEWLTEQPHKHIIVVPGNHDKPAEQLPIRCRQAFENENINFLINQEVVIESVKFWGSPVTPTFFNWHFMKNRGDHISKVWAQIPDDVDVLITHGPSYGHGDLVPPYRGGRPKVAGCLDLLNRLREIKNKTCFKYPRVHCFGHIHAGHGATQSDEFGSMTFINASICTEQYQPTNDPIEFEIASRS
jgi:Icc-related predicted phosphoesterase